MFDLTDTEAVEAHLTKLQDRIDALLANPPDDLTELNDLVIEYGNLVTAKTKKLLQDIENDNP